MSALGQKRTYAVHNRMSALPSKADMGGAVRDVCFGPIADIDVSRSVGGTFGLQQELSRIPSIC
jgi:hypothetical protein